MGGARYDRVCDLPVPLMLPVEGQVAVAAWWSDPAGNRIPA